VLTFLVIAVPTFFMGGTLPAVARSVTAEDDTQRGGVAVLYGLNTIGAVCGAAFATFWLLPHTGNRATLYLGCALNLVVALAAHLRSRTLSEVPLSGATPAQGSESKEARLPRGLVLGAAFAVGAVFFLMEIVWFRMLSPLLGGTVFTFGLVLCVALAGIGLGGAAYGWLAKRGPVTLSTFALTCLLEALAVAIPLGLGDRLAWLTMLFRPLISNGLGSASVGWTLIAAVVVFPAAFIAGVQFPVLIALAGRAREQVARHVAQVYFANTTGSVLGSLVGGFGILPALSAPGTWRLSAAVLLALGLVAASVAGDTRRVGRALQIGAITAATVACLLALGPTPVWRHSSIGAGRADETAIGNPDARESVSRSLRSAFLWEKDGVEAGVGLFQSTAYAFIVNGKSDGSSTMDAATQIMSGLLGAMLHPEPKKVLVIGLGTGSTAGWLGLVPGIERVDVMEFEPVILDVARTMSAINGDVLNNPRVHIKLGDARELLALEKEQYDVIFSEPSNPFRVGIANLFTREYYQQALARLKPGGLFIQWMQAYEIDAMTLAEVYATLHSVFPSVETWYGARTDFLLVGSREPVRHDAAQIAERVKQEPFSSALQWTWYTQSTEGFFTHLLAGPKFTEFLLDRARPKVNTDDFNRIEFGIARTFSRGANLISEFVAVTNRFSEAYPRFPEGLDPELLRFEMWGSGQNRRVEGIADAPASWPMHDRALARATQARVQGDLGLVAETWPVDHAPRTSDERLTRLTLWAVNGNPAFAAEAEALRALFPFDVAALEAIAAEQKRDDEAAVTAWEKAFIALRTNPWHQSRLLYTALESLPRQPRSDALNRRLFAVLAEPFAAKHVDSSRRAALMRLSERLGDWEACAKLYEAVFPNTPWNQEDLTRAVTCFKEKRPALLDAATADLARFLATRPTTLKQLGVRIDRPDAGTQAPTPPPGQEHWLESQDGGTPTGASKMAP
jgi:spermidine synthase